MKTKDIYCPYCGKKAFIKDGAFVHGENAVTSHLYVCSGYPECDSYVGVHKSNLQPLGYLANAELRKKRIQAHRVFDSIWKSKILPRNQAYKWMQDRFCLSSSNAHIGYFSEYMCEKLIEASEMVLINNGKAKKQVMI